MDQLPDYMKICFLALHNSVNEMALDTVKEQRFHIIEYLKKAVWNWLLYSSILILNIFFFLNTLCYTTPNSSFHNKFAVGRFM